MTNNKIKKNSLIQVLDLIMSLALSHGILPAVMLSEVSEAHAESKKRKNKWSSLSSNRQQRYDMNFLQGSAKIHIILQMPLKQDVIFW